MNPSGQDACTNENIDSNMEEPNNLTGSSPSRDETMQNSIQIVMTDTVDNVFQRFSDTNSLAFNKFAENLSSSISQSLTLGINQMGALMTQTLKSLLEHTGGTGQNTEEPSVDPKIGRNTEKAVGQRDSRNTGKLPVDIHDVLSLAGSRISRLSSRSRSRSRSTTKSPAPSSSRHRSSKSVISGKSHHKSHHSQQKAATVAGDGGKTLEKDQEYWESQLSNYQLDQKLGPEASKVFWQKSINEDHLKTILTSSQVPANCGFLQVQQVNKEIWSSTSGDVRTRDYGLQNVQKTHGAMVSNILQATHMLDDTKAELAKVSKDLAAKFDPAMDKLRDALILAGCTNLQINGHRRDSFKPSISKDLKNIAEQPEEDSSKWLFGDNLKDRLTQIRGDNSIRQEFMKKDEPKRSFNYTGFSKETQNSASQSKKPRSENFRPPQNSRGGATSGYYQRDRESKNTYKKGWQNKNRSYRSKFEKKKKPQK